MNVHDGLRPGRSRHALSRRSATVLFAALIFLGGGREAFDDARQFVAGTATLHLTSSVGGSGPFEAVRLTLRDLFSPEESAPILVPSDLVSGEEDDLALITSEIRDEFFRTVPYGELIHEKSVEHEIDPALVAAVIEVESSFRRRARSPRGARGLMQLMPATGRWMGARDLEDPEQNIDAGVRYLKYLSDRFEGDIDRQLAAYNAGEGNVMRYGGVPPFRETRTYIRKVLRNYERNQARMSELRSDSRHPPDELRTANH